MSTIRDVARAAGVSIATVSRVFNASEHVSDETRRRVQSASTKLDYWPNVAARSLTTSRAHALGVLLPDLYGEFFSEVIRGVDNAARREKYQILISSSHADTNDLLAAARSMRGRIDGLIAMAPDKGSAAAIEEITRSCPVVLLNPRSHVVGCDTVSIANFDGARAVVHHLIGLGHRDIAMVKGPAGNVDAEERWRGYREALRAAGIRPRLALEIQGDFTECSGYEATGRILQLQPRPTAVFAANDYMAIGLLSALREAGIEVPSQMAVTGFDDIAIAQYVNPPLTTVRVNAYELGDRAIRMWIAAQSTNGRGRSHELLPTELVVRESSGATPPRGSTSRQRGSRVRQSESIQPPQSRHSPTARPQTRRRKS